MGGSYRCLRGPGIALSIDHGRRRALCLAVLLIVTALLPAAGGAASAHCWDRDTAAESVTSTPKPSPDAPIPAFVAVTPPPAAKDVSPAGRVLVRVSAGRLTDVQMV